MDGASHLGRTEDENNLSGPAHSRLDPHGPGQTTSAASRTVRSLPPAAEYPKTSPFLPPPTAGPRAPSGARASRNGAVSWPVDSSISASSSSSTLVFVQPKPSASSFLLLPSDQEHRRDGTSTTPAPPSHFLEKIHGENHELLQLAPLPQRPHPSPSPSPSLARSPPAAQKKKGKLFFLRFSLPQFEYLTIHPPH